MSIHLLKINSIRYCYLNRSTVINNGAVGGYKTILVKSRSFTSLVGVDKGLNRLTTKEGGRTTTTTTTTTTNTANTNHTISHTTTTPRTIASRKLSPTSIRYLHNVQKPRFKFTIAEAYCPKKRYEYDHQERVPRDSSNDIFGDKQGHAHTGEDAFFIREWNSSGPLQGSQAFAVADGVGGWASVGINPSKFSHGLCERMANEFKKSEDNINSQDPKSETYHDDRTTTASPQSLLEAAYSSLRKEGDAFAGGSTACVGVASAFTGMLSIANIGDSGYFIFRQRRVYRRSSPQTHQFNTPFQLSIVPSAMLSRRHGRKPISDEPQDADLAQHQLRHGDVVVLATDGLTDNVFAQDILKLVTRGMYHSHLWINSDDAKDDEELFEQEPPGFDVPSGAREIAKNLVRAGISASLDPNSESPFTLRLRQDMGFIAPGGKPDDITVLVMIVEELGHDDIED